MHRRLFIVSSVTALAIPSLPGCVAQPIGGDPIGDLVNSTRPGTLIGTSGDAAFDAWLSDFYARALRAGWDDGLLIRELSGLTPDPRVVASDTKQPEFSKPTGDYIKGAPRHPILEDDVVIYAGATVLGRISIGRGATIGGNRTNTLRVRVLPKRC